MSKIKTALHTLDQAWTQRKGPSDLRSLTDNALNTMMKDRHPSFVESILRLFRDVVEIEKQDKSKNGSRDFRHPMASTYVKHFLNREKLIDRCVSTKAMNAAQRFLIIEMCARASVRSRWNWDGCSVKTRQARDHCIEAVEGVPFNEVASSEAIDWQEIFRFIRQVPTSEETTETTRDLACAVVWCGLVLPNGYVADEEYLGAQCIGVTRETFLRWRTHGLRNLGQNYLAYQLGLRRARSVAV